MDVRSDLDRPVGSVDERQRAALVRVAVGIELELAWRDSDCARSVRRCPGHLRSLRFNPRKLCANCRYRAPEVAGLAHFPGREGYESRQSGAGPGLLDRLVQRDELAAVGKG